MKLNRRRLLIAAGAAGLAGLSRFAGDRDSGLKWTGTALGADAEIHIEGLDWGRASQLIFRVTAEIERLESIFSLYRPDSEVSRLNRDGVLHNPSHDFRLLLARSLDFHEQTDGAFNIAVQPLWVHLARHFAEHQDPSLPPSLDGMLALCNPARISASPSRIVIGAGMGLTFNGIAQGYITDAVAALFRHEGLQDILISLGETLALPGRPWVVAIAGEEEHVVHLRDGAIAQSSGRGTAFTADGRWHHLLDPQTGASANRFRAVTVQAPTATEADALSTALFVASAHSFDGIAARFPQARLFPVPVPT